MAEATGACSTHMHTHPSVPRVDVSQRNQRSREKEKGKRKRKEGGVQGCSQGREVRFLTGTLTLARGSTLQGLGSSFCS